MRQASALLLLAASLALPGCSDGAKPSTEDSAKPESKVDLEATSDEPRTYQSPNGRFRATFPGDPSVGDRPADSKAGTIGTETYSVIRLPRSYMIECSHLAEPRDPQKEIQRLIADSQGSGDDLKVLESKDVTLKGRPGKDTLCAVEDDRLCRERFFVDGKDLYHIISIVPKTDEDARSAAAFVESFELLKD
jgi:hypothetical protein